MPLDPGIEDFDMSDGFLRATTPISLLTKLSKIQNEVGVLVEAATGQIGTRSYRYIDLPSVVAAVKPVLDRHAVVVNQTIGIDGYRDRYDTLTTTVTDLESGEQISTTARLILTKEDPQAQGSAITYARRYNYVTILGLVADEDDDGAKASPVVIPIIDHVPTVHRESPMAARELVAPSMPTVKIDGEVTAPQLKKLGYEFGRTGFQSDENKHQYASLMTGREVYSLNQLTKKEASTLIEALVGEPDAS